MLAPVLNFHHLRYFWAVAREGGVTRAARSLRVSQPAVSAQLRALEQELGEKLLARSGRGLVPTEAGRVALRYAEEIFGLGAEMVETLKGRPTGRPARLAVGIVNVIPKLVAHRLLQPALQAAGPLRIVCVEDRLERLLADLATHELDLVLADAPAGAATRVRAYSHLLGESGVSIFGIEALRDAYRRGFPRSLDGAPFLLPTPDATLRQILDHWLSARRIRPRIVGEFEDSALLGVFGQSGAGLFAAPSVLERDVRRQYGARLLGRIEARERFYALTVERRLRHPALVALFDTAREELFV